MGVWGRSPQPIFLAVPNTPLFVKTHDFVVWLFNHTQRFPKNLRHSYSQRLETVALEFEEAILMANAVRGAARKARVEIADGKLLCLPWQQYARLPKLAGELAVFAEIGELTA